MMLSYTQIFAALAIFLFLYHHGSRRCKDPIVKDWPIVGMLPQLLFNLWHIHDYVTPLLTNASRTTNFKGPWFSRMNYLVIADPMNIHYTMSKNFGNYIKGPEFREIFEPFGEGVLTMDSEVWRYSRELLHSVFKSRRFERFMEKTVRNKLDACLLPLLDEVERQGVEVDLQEVFNRFNFDNISSIVLGFDPKSLAFDFPNVTCEKAFNEAEEFIFYRHIVPRPIWKFQKWLGVGPEKKMAEASATFDKFLRESIASNRGRAWDDRNNDQCDLITLLMRHEEGKDRANDKFLRDTASSLFIAGKDTITSALTWLFWLVATHPYVEAKILQEMKTKDNNNNNNVYLHGAICEALRLYPPIPFERKQALNDDVLPSGHEVKGNTTILFSFYTMGRDEDIWGKDCLEFKPERWISESGHIIHVPSYKFICFNAGPRNCLGKNFTFVQLKMVANAIFDRYHIQVVEDHHVSTAHSIVLLMKHGLKAHVFFSKPLNGLNHIAISTWGPK
ncbi:alkane hydroxylase MAH1-like [Senna tora]|uniref:Alkane hydroxylase MAH1-like n=1 Tax=Senna tora TaxID=362788 RepID=A0A834XEE0_9FABA|nr:alkane hydroxylase MAH1-like [Senna tora]